MIDYKLVLILILSIVLVYLYNKIEDLKDDVSTLKKKISINEKQKTSDELLSLFNKDNIVINDQKIQDQCIDSKCKLPIINNNQNMEETFIIDDNDNKKDNTSQYQATESSDTLNINYEKSSEKEDDNDEFIVFSNDKENNLENEIINFDVQSVIENIVNNDILNNDRFILETNSLLSKTYEGNIDIINESSNSDEKNNIDIEELETLSEKSDKILNEFDNINIIQEDGNIVLERDNDEHSKSSNSIDEINTSEARKNNLNSLTKYKLDELQLIAKKNNITITKSKNGKQINKTKQELYNEITIYNEKN